MGGPAYHGRTHCPGGTDPIPCLTSSVSGFHAHTTTNFSVSDNNDAIIRWDTWQNDDAAVYADGTIVSSKLEDVKLLVAGWYAVHCWVYWNSGFVGSTGIMMIHDDTDIGEPALMQSQPVGFGFHLRDVTTFQVVRYLPPVFESTITLAWIDRLEFWVSQNSGGSRDVDEAYLNIGYLGAAT